MAFVGWNAFFEAASGLLYPRHCAGCGSGISRGVLCRSCSHERPRLTGPRCAVCSQPYGGAVDPGFRCMNCGDLELSFDFATSAYRSRGVVRDLIHRFKYGRQFHLRHLLARMLCEGFREPRIARLSVDALVPVPLHPARQREREFNQSAVLAQLASARLRRPVMDCLVRRRYTVTQTHFHREERLENLRDAFALRRGSDVDGLALALVDDVLTTGSTAHACAEVLKEAGASAVVVITVARG